MGRFQRDITFLEQNLIPQTNSGNHIPSWCILKYLGKEIKKLDYKGEEHEQLSDADIQQLCNSLKNPDCKFKGPLNLKDNSQLTDLSALYIAEVLQRTETSKAYISQLNISNTKMQEKAGLFIGEALLANPRYPIDRIKFKNVKLEESGLYRIIEATNANKNIKRIHIGVISDYGLKTMAELLKLNNSLLRLEF